MDVLIIVTLFLFLKISQAFLNKKNEINRKEINRIKKEIISTIEPYEDELNIKKIPIHHLRIINVFFSLKEPKQKEELRQLLIQIVNGGSGKPSYNLWIFLYSTFLHLIFFYYIFIFMYNEPNFYFSLALLILSSFFWFLYKRYILMTLFAAVGIYIYFKLPYTVVLYLLLNISYNLIHYTIKKNKKMRYQ